MRGHFKAAGERKGQGKEGRGKGREKSLPFGNCYSFRDVAVEQCVMESSNKI